VQRGGDTESSAQVTLTRSSPEQHLGSQENKAGIKLIEKLEISDILLQISVINFVLTLTKSPPPFSITVKERVYRFRPSDKLLS